MESFELLGDRLKNSFLVVPSLTDWGICVSVLLVYAAIAFPIGFWTGLLQYERVKSKSAIVTHVGVALIFPALIEEIIFRVLLIPHPFEESGLEALVGWSLLSLVIFIASHPLNGWLLLKSRQATFFNPWFLVLAGLLGVGCTVTYVTSRSLWPPVVLHWVVVVIWLVFLGGDRRMSGLQAETPLQKSPINNDGKPR